MRVESLRAGPLKSAEFRVSRHLILILNKMPPTMAQVNLTTQKALKLRPNTKKQYAGYAGVPNVPVRDLASDYNHGQSENYRIVTPSTVAHHCILCFPISPLPTHLISPSIADKAALLTFSEINLFSSSQDLGHKISCLHKY